MTVAKAKPQRESLIVDGRYMKCPRCRVDHDILKYVPMGTIKEFAAETNPVYKCPSCRWIFSPTETVVQEIFSSPNSD